MKLIMFKNFLEKFEKILEKGKNDTFEEILKKYCKYWYMAKTLNNFRVILNNSEIMSEKS